MLLFLELKNILILGTFTGTCTGTFTAEAKYFINFSKRGKRFVLNLHYNVSSSFSLLMLQKYITSQQNILK